MRRPPASRPKIDAIIRITPPPRCRITGTATATVSVEVVEFQPKIISGTVFVDADNDGALDSGERRLAGTVFLVVMLAGLSLIEFLTLTLKTVPFTCSYLPGQLKLRIYWAPYFFLWLQFVFTLANWCLWAFQGTRQTLQLAAFLGAVWLGLRLWHMARARKITAFIYDEQEPSLVTTMDIATSMRQV